MPIEPVTPGLLGFAIPLVLFLLWAASCVWAMAKLRSMDVALVSQVAWAAVLLLFPVLGFLLFLLLGDRTPQMERELGIRRIA